MNANFETLTLAELADRLEDLDGRRTPVGWTPDDAAERASVERCILTLLTSTTSTSAQALPCELELRLRSKEQIRPARLREIRPGGVVIDVDGSWVVNTHVEMQVRQHDSDEHDLRVRGIIARVDPGAVLVSVAEQPSEAHERRLRRFLMEIMRHRVHN